MPDDYTLVGWSNDNPPAINQTNLNKMDDGIKDSIIGIKNIYPYFSLNWNLGWTINDTGTISASVYQAMTDIIPCNSGVIQRLVDNYDTVPKSLLFYVHEYEDGVWKKRTHIYKYNYVELAANTNGVRIVFGRTVASGIPITQADIDTYFNMQFYTNSASISVLNSVKKYLPEFPFTWMFGKNVDANGNVVDGSTYGATTPIYVYGGSVVSYTLDNDSSGNVLAFRIAEYKNGVFQRRTAVKCGKSLTLGSDTTEIRIGMGRSASTGIAFSQSDIDTYFNAEIYSEALSKGEYYKDKQSSGSSPNLLSLIYQSGAGDDSSTEQLQVVIPVNEDNSVKFLLGHCVDASANVNADVWRIIYAYKNTTQITRRGEWECALHLANRDDFSGGIVHGDEIDQQVNFFVDGVNISVSDLDGVQCSELKIVRNSNMYDPADHTTVICEHGVEYSFSVDGLKIKQTIKWKVAETLTNCYLAMLPIIKAYSQYRYSDISFEVKENTLTNYSFSIPNAKSVSEYSPTNETFFSMSIPKYPEGLPGGDKATITDNSGINYNKVYFVICTSGNSTVDELWKSETVYRFK